MFALFTYKKPKQIKVATPCTLNENSIAKAVQKAMPDPYYVRDMDYNVVFWPKSMEELTGYTEREALGAKCKDVINAPVCADCPTTKCVLQKSFLKNAKATNNLEQLSSSLHKQTTLLDQDAEMLSITQKKQPIH